MKPLTCSSFLMLLITVVFSACRGPEAKEALTSSASINLVPSEKYEIDRKESVVIWFGSNVLASQGSHTGYVYLSKGELLMVKDQLAGGSVVVDMNTIVDEKHGSDNDLVEHLKSPDFFDVAKFPVTAFAITMAVPANDSTVNVTGNLTIKGITHAVTFPATIKLKDGVVQANGKLMIDRTRWDVRYNSKKFFADLADGVISDDIEFDIKIIAKKYQ
ncbi:MAG TPA: YceI family protein [Cyclobacteriaceae bacterium]